MTETVFALSVVLLQHFLWIRFLQELAGLTRSNTRNIGPLYKNEKWLYVFLHLLLFYVNVLSWWFSECAYNTSWRSSLRPAQVDEVLFLCCV